MGEGCAAAWLLGSACRTASATARSLTLRVHKKTQVTASL